MTFVFLHRQLRGCFGTCSVWGSGVLTGKQHTQNSKGQCVLADRKIRTNMTLDILTSIFINFTILCKLCKLYKLSDPNIPYRNPGVFFYIPPKMSDVFFFSRGTWSVGEPKGGASRPMTSMVAEAFLVWRNSRPGLNLRAYLKTKLGFWPSFTRRKYSRELRS